MKKALITGITGQDGSYLAELLLEKGYRVHGITRRSSQNSYLRIKHLCDDESIKDRFFLHEGDLADAFSLQRVYDQVEPDEIYQLAAMSDVKISFDMPSYCADINTLGTIRFLEIMKDRYPGVKFYQASTSELFGKVQEIPQTEKTAFYLRSPYAISKLAAFWSVVNYREAYQIFACNGILFNHESPRRGENFVSKKITSTVAKIKKNLQKTLVLGNLDAQRDWGYAKDFVEGMWLMLQQENPDDFILATGRTTSVRHFTELSFKAIGISIEWQGSGVKEKGINSMTGETLVEVSPNLFRPTEVDLLLGDASKAKEKLQWKPKTTVEELVQIMVHADLDVLSNHLCSV